VQAFAIRIMVVVVVAAMAAWGGYSHGRKIERADWMHQIAKQKADADIRARAVAEAESKRAAEAQSERDRLAQQISRMKRDAKRAAVPVTDCRIDAAEQRLLDDELAAYRSAKPGAAGAVHDTVHRDAGPSSSWGDLSGGSERSESMGLRLPATASGVHRLD